MNQLELETCIKEMAESAQGEQGFVEFKFQSLLLYLISDTVHDRMRIISPVIAYEELNPHQLLTLLESNYHRSLDARYAVSDGVLYAAYIHPLSLLTVEQIESAIIQVANLAASFGAEYSSGVLTYGGHQ